MRPSTFIIIVKVADLRGLRLGGHAKRTNQFGWREVVDLIINPCVYEKHVNITVKDNLSDSSKL